MLSREHVDCVAANAELPAREFHIVAFVLDADQMRNQIPLFDLVTDFQDKTHLGIGLRLTDTVDGRHGRDNDHITAFEHAL